MRLGWDAENGIELLQRPVFRLGDVADQNDES